MGKRLATVFIAAAALLVVLPSFAQDVSGGGRGPCAIEGTWYGSNSAYLNYIFRIEKNAAGGHTVVADGFADPEVIVYCLEFTAWHGELVKTGPRSFLFRQIELCDPNPDVFGPIPGLLLWAGEGEFTQTGCDHLEASIPIVGAYFWNPLDPEFEPPVPFIDPFDIPFAEVTGSFDRMPRP